MPHGSGTSYGEYESEGGRIWREFRDGKLTKEQYNQKMQELRDQIKQERERAEREQYERERPEREARARAAAEEGRARARAYQEAAEERARQRREQEERNKKVSMNNESNPFQPAESLGGSFLPSSPNARDMASEMAQAPKNEGEHHHHPE